MNSILDADLVRQSLVEVFGDKSPRKHGRYVKYIQEKYPDLYTRYCQLDRMFPDSRFGQKLHHMLGFPIGECKVCGKLPNFASTQDREPYGYYLDTCSYACSNVHTRQHNERYIASLFENRRTVPVTDKKTLDKLRRVFKRIDPKAHEISIVKALEKQPELLGTYINLPCEDHFGDRKRFLLECDAVRYCKTCGQLIPFSSSYRTPYNAKNYCSHDCYAQESSKKLRTKRTKAKQVIAKFRAEPYEFTKQDIKLFTSLYNECGKPRLELDVLRHLYRNDRKMLVSYCSLPAMRYASRLRLALGEVPFEHCKTCGKLLRYGSEYAYQIEFCSNDCAMKHEQTKERRRKTVRKVYGVDYVAQCTEVQAKQQQTCIQRYGTPNYTQSHVAKLNWKGTFFKYKEYTLNGRIVKIQGYEDRVIDYMLNGGVPQNLIYCGEEKDVPFFDYMFKGSQKRYYPDFFIDLDCPTIAECKSLRTLFIRKSEFYKTCAKAKAVMSEDYRFALFLMTHNGTRLRLPKNWWNMSYSTVKRYVENQL